MSPAEQESDSLNSLEDRIQRAVQLVGRLRQEREAAVEEAAQARREAALLAADVKALQKIFSNKEYLNTDPKNVRVLLGKTEDKDQQAT